MGVSNDIKSNRYYVRAVSLAVRNTTNPTSGMDYHHGDYQYEIRDSMIGSSANTDRTVSVHEDKELAIKLCRLANSAWRDVIYQANFSGKT
jgi:hypothetical protein